MTICSLCRVDSASILSTLSASVPGSLVSATSVTGESLRSVSKITAMGVSGLLHGRGHMSHHVINPAPIGSVAVAVHYVGSPNTGGEG